MITDLVQISRLGEKKKEENRRLRVHLKHHNYVERKLKKIAQEIEDAIDCTVCANCCKLATARVKDREIDTLAKFIGASRSEFLRNYTDLSEEEGLILKRNEKGCVFLEGNLCSIYEGRPYACQHFPNLAKGDGPITTRMWEMVDRATYCPIVYNTLEAFKDEVGFKR